jgi:hypothetical protein
VTSAICCDCLFTSIPREQEAEEQAKKDAEEKVVQDKEAAERAIRDKEEEKTRKASGVRQGPNRNEFKVAKGSPAQVCPLISSPPSSPNGTPEQKKRRAKRTIGNTATTKPGGNVAAAHAADTLHRELQLVEEAEYQREREQERAKLAALQRARDEQERLAYEEQELKEQEKREERERLEREAAKAKAALAATVLKNELEAIATPLTAADVVRPKMFQVFVQVV